MNRICLVFIAFVSAVSVEAQTPGASEPRAVVEAVYAAFAQGDMEGFAASMAPEMVWNEAEGNPYADLNPYLGPEAVMSGLISRLVDEWEDISVTPNEFVVEGERVVVFGRYKETWKATGETIDIPFVHSWTVEDGKLVAFQQYTDTAALVETMGGRASDTHANPHQPVDLSPTDRSLVKLDRLPDPVEARWKGASVCDVLHNDTYQRVLRCTFPPTVGHERHYHKRHFGYVIAGGRMQITDATGTRVVEPATGAHFKSDGIGWHEVVNIGDSTATYLIMEPK